MSEPNIIGEAEFKCRECGEAHTLQSADFNFRAVASPEDGADEGTQYESAHEAPCRKCGHGIRVVFVVREEPKGEFALSGIETNANGVRMKSRFAVSRPTAVKKHLPRFDKNRVWLTAVGGAATGTALGGPMGGMVGAIFGAWLGDSLNKQSMRR